MAKGRTRFPFDSLEGNIGRTDNSRGLWGGIASFFTKTRTGTIYGASGDHSKVKSLLQRSRSEVYCDCDTFWKLFNSVRRARVRSWWIWTRRLKEWTYPDYHTWMKQCLSGSVEGVCYHLYRWVGRYGFYNPGPLTYAAQWVYLRDVPGVSWDHPGHVVCPRGPDEKLLAPVASEAVGLGVVRFMMPECKPKTLFRWDVYAVPEV